jgi:hypothetical protein
VKEEVGDPTMKSGKGDVRRIAPNSKLFEFGHGYKTTPAPGSLSDEAHGATATCDVIALFNTEDIGKFSESRLTIWFRSKMRDNEAKLFWLVPIACGSSTRSGIKVQMGGACRLTHAPKSSKVDISCVI